MSTEAIWLCHLTVLSDKGDVHEHYGYGESPRQARDGALDEAAIFAIDNEYSFAIIGERYA